MPITAPLSKTADKVPSEATLTSCSLPVALPSLVILLTWVVPAFCRKAVARSKVRDALSMPMPVAQRMPAVADDAPISSSVSPAAPNRVVFARSSVPSGVNRINPDVIRPFVSPANSASRPRTSPNHSLAAFFKTDRVRVRVLPFESVIGMLISKSGLVPLAGLAAYWAMLLVTAL